MKKLLLLSGLIVVLSGCSTAGMQASKYPCESEAEGIEIVDYGIAAASSRPSIRHKKIVKQTDEIQLKRDRKFGMFFRIEGERAGELIEIRIVVVHPPIRNPGKGDTTHRFEQQELMRIGELNYTGYEFDTKWQMVPGEWVFEIWCGDRKIGEKAFLLFE